MTVMLELPADVETALRRRAAALGQDVESFLRQVVTESIAIDEPAAVPTKRARSFRDRMEAWAARHPVVPQPVDDSRESIYAGRGE